MGFVELTAQVHHQAEDNPLLDNDAFPAGANPLVHYSRANDLYHHVPAHPAGRDENLSNPRQEIATWSHLGLCE